MSNVHSCHAGCREPLCVLRREKDLRAERDALQSEVARLKSERDAQVSEKVKAIGLYGLEVLETKRLREALEFYADYEEWVDYKAVCTDGTGVDSHFDGDMGQRAREALQQSSVPHPGEES